MAFGDNDFYIVGNCNALNGSTATVGNNFIDSDKELTYDERYKLLAGN